MAAGLNDRGPMKVPDPASPVALKDRRNGMMALLRRDLYIGRSLDLYGEFDQLETAMFPRLVQPGMAVVEVDANIGAHTLPLARMPGPHNAVVAREPQRAMFQLLCANVALKGLFNLHTLPAGTGREAGSLGEEAPVDTLDSLALPAAQLIKMEVEGMDIESFRKVADPSEWMAVS